jgi:hypothetical protein
MARPKYKFTQYEIMAIKHFRKEGKSMEQIAKIFGIPKTTFHDRIRDNGLADLPKATKEIVEAALKESIWHHSFSHEIEEREYEMVEFLNPKTGKRKRVPQLKKIKTKIVAPLPIALQIATINKLRWATSMAKLDIADEEGKSKPGTVYIVTAGKPEEKENDEK